MLAVARKNTIKEVILEKKSVTVVELSALFNVTEETIRRDLKNLEEEGALTRTYGGAFLDQGVQSDIKLAVRESSLVDNKKRMCKSCRKLIANGDSIFLDTSTSVLPICDLIADMRLTVLTNSLKVATKLAERENIKLILMGGVLSSSSLSLFSPTAIRYMENYYVDKAFMSCRSLHMNFGLSDTSESHAVVRRLVIERSGQVHLLADHTKFNKVSFVKIDGIESINTLITDDVLTEEWREFLQKSNVELIECTAS